MRWPRLGRLHGEKPEGAFYLFLPTPIADDVRFADALRKRRILTVPGSGFFGPGDIRIAYCVDDETILGAIEGFGEVWKEFSKRGDAPEGERVPRGMNRRWQSR